MDYKNYEILGFTSDRNFREISKEEITQNYENLKKKYSEDRFLDGEAGNEAARMLHKIEVAYQEICAELDNTTSLNAVDACIRKNQLNEAQTLLDKFDERSAEWHYLQSVIYYKRNWINECKKQLEIAMQLDANNDKYKNAHKKLVDKIDYEKAIAQASYTEVGTNHYNTNQQDPYNQQNSQYRNPNGQNYNQNYNNQNQMGGTGGVNCCDCILGALMCQICCRH